MTLIERFWAVVTSIVSIASLSPIPNGSDNQTPFQLPLEVSPFKPVKPVKGYPSFSPPGAPNDFKCEYPDMKGWEDCSHELDRKCWLRHTASGRQLDINTDYENVWPIGKERRYHIDLTNTSYSADGKNFPEAKLFGLNGSNYEYPGPWIQACWGDRLIVNVTNSLPHNGTSVHWHGIRQLNTTHMDGVNGVTQCPIAPGDYFVYNFTLHQYGSSWYHSHYSVQYADGAAGPLTIHGPSSSDWEEAISPPLIMTDWYHNSSFAVVSNGDDGGKNILLNGRGNITKFDNSTTNTTAVEPLLSINFDPPRPGKGCKKYLLRVINTSFDTTFVFSIDNHLLQIVSADFVPIQPYHNTSILVGIGQRYNVIVEANPLDKDSPLANDGNYWIRTEIANCFRGSNQGSPGYEELGILRYNASSKSSPSTRKWSHISLDCSDETYTSLHPILPWKVDPPSNGITNGAAPRFGQEFDVAFTGKRKDYPLAIFTMDEYAKSTSMRVNYSDPTFLRLGPGNETFDDLWRVEREDYTNNDWIYLVLHGFQSKASAHPIHLHGHDFAILEQAQNKTWNASNMNLKLDNPPRRDVVLLPTDGYVVIAFKADNPGPWLVHCHIATHISMGLGMQIMENQQGAFDIWPDDDSAIKEAQRVCNKWNDWHNNTDHWAYKPKKLGGKCTEENWDYCFQDDSGV